MLTLLVIALAVLFISVVWGFAVDWFWSDWPTILSWLALVVLVADITVIVCIYINTGVWIWNQT